MQQLTEERWKQLLMTEALRGVQIAPALFGAACCATLWTYTARPSATWIGAVLTLAVGLFWATRVSQAIKGVHRAHADWTRTLADEHGKTEQAQRDGEVAVRRAQEEETRRTEEVRIRAEERGRKEGRESEAGKFKESWSDERIRGALTLCPVSGHARISHPKPDVVITYDTSFACPFVGTLVVERLTMMVGAHEIKSINVGRELPIPPGARGNHPPFVVELLPQEAADIRAHASCERHAVGSVFIVGQIKCDWTNTAISWKGAFPMSVDLT